MTYQQVDELGYANRGTLYRIVHRTLDDHEAQNVNLLRLLEDGARQVQRYSWRDCAERTLNVLLATR